MNHPNATPGRNEGPGRSAGPPASGRRFAALRHRNFALFWFASMFSNSGSWMQNIAQGWLVYNLTNSPFLLGVVAFARAVPLLVLPLVGGVLADRVPRLKLMKITQTLSLVLALIFGVLVSTNLIQVWQIIFLSFLSGIVSSFDQPTQQALLPDLVPRDDLAGAIALNSSTWQGAALFGPTLAGLMVAFVSLAGAFYANAVSYLAVIIALYLMHGVPERSSNRSTSGLLGDLSEGLRYVGSTRLVATLLGLAALSSIFGRPFQQLLPVFARDVLHVGATGLGFMASAPGAGALVGAALVATAGAIDRKGRILFGAMFLMSGTLVLFALSKYFAVSLAALFVIGLTSILFSTMLNTMLQLETPPQMRGRVMSLLTVTMQGMNPFGAVLAGALATAIGTPAAIATGAVILAVAGIAAVIGSPHVRRFSTSRGRGPVPASPGAAAGS
jgi:MFS family permease